METKIGDDYFEANDIVAFEIKDRKLNFLGTLNFKDLQYLYNNRIFYKDRDKKGRFMKEKITDSYGNVISDDDIKGEVGFIEFDTDYLSVYCKYFRDCNEKELYAIEKANGVFLTHEFIRY